MSADVVLMRTKRGRKVTRRVRAYAPGARTICAFTSYATASWRKISEDSGERRNENSAHWPSLTCTAI
eukprot:scaffold308477_cov26-Tisochrysis_lutea.AAC.1